MIVASSGSHQVVGPKARESKVMLKKLNSLVVGRNFFSSSRAKWGLETQQTASRQKALSATRLMPLILFITAILALAISGAAVAKKCDTPPCGGDGGDSSPYYNVTVIWPSEYPYDGGFGGGGDYWTASNNGSIDYAPFDPDFLPDDTTGILNLDFIQAYFDTALGFGEGTACFPDTSVRLYPAGVSYKKSTGALARFWFEGYTHSLTPPVRVLYLLSFFTGQLAEKKDWPPASLNTMTWGASVESSEWKLKPENEGAEIQANSCTRERGKFDPAPWGGPVSIEVENVPKP
jgi:hypothetical protein